MMTSSEKALKGGCQCGNIRYQINGEPITLYACHCLHCQAQSSSAFGLSMWVENRDFELLSGKLKSWTEKAGDGSAKLCAFCPECGSRIYHAIEGDNGILSLKAGSLDDKELLTPVAHIWTKRAHKWLGLEKQGVSCFETEPKNFSEIIEAWKSRDNATVD